MSNPEVKIRLSLDGAQQVQAGAQNAAASMDKLGASSAKVGQAAQISGQQVAQVSAQLQDLFIQIQGGQAPLTALLQQGSQLSTVFGGTGAALRAVTGTVAAMVTPLTVAGAAAAGLAVAFYKGSQDLGQFERALALSGSIAGVTAMQMASMADEIARIGSGSRGRSVEVLTEMATSARVGAENLQRFTAAAVEMERVGGRSAENTAKIYADLAKAPLEAALKQNEATNFLTRSTYEQIKALESVGAKTEAARIASEAFYESESRRARDAAQSLGFLERQWNDLGKAINNVWEVTKSLGRDDSLADLERKLRNAQLALNDAGPAGLMALYYERNVQSLTQQVELMREGESWARAWASAEAERAQQVRAASDFDKLADKYRGSWDGLQQQLSQIVTLGVEAGKSVGDIVAVVNEARAAYAQPIALDGLRAAEARRVEEIKRGINSINALRAQGYISETTSIQELTRLDIASLDARKVALGNEIALLSKRKDSERETSALRAQIAGLDAQRETIRLKGINDVTTAIDKQRKAIEALYEAQRAQTREEVDAAFVADSKSRERARLAIDDYARGLKRESEMLAVEASMIGRTRAERELAIAQLRIEADLKTRISDIDSNLAFDEAQRAAERERLRSAAAVAQQNAVTRAQLTQIDDQINSIDRTAQRVWTDFGDDAATAAQRAGRTIKAAVWDLLYQMTIKKWVVNIAANVLGATGVPGVGGAGGVLGAASSASNLYNAAGAAAGIWGSSAAYGAALGTTSIGAGSQAAMLASQTGVFGAEGAAMTAAAAGNAAAGSVMSSVAAAAPYLAAVLAVVAIAKSLDDSGTIHTGASSEYSSAKGLATGMGLYGVGSKAGAYGAQTEIMTTEIAKGIVGILDSTASTFGKEAGYQAASAFADDTSKDGAWGALSIKIGDRIVEGFGQDGNGRWPGQSFSDGQAGTQEYLAAVSADVRRALEQIGLPQWATNMLDQLGEAPSLDQLAQTVATINATQAALAGLGDAMPAFAALTNGATQTLLEAFGGINNLASTAQGYYQNFYTEAERAARTTQLVSKELADLGFAMPTTREGFRALVEQQLAMGDAGAKTAAELLKLQGAFASVVAETATAGEVFDQTAADLARAAETMAEAGRRALASLAEDQGSLMVELLNAQGKTAEAQALARQQALAKITAGLSAADTDAATAAYDYNQSLRDQVAALLAATDAQKQAAEAAAQAERTAQAAAEAAISAAQQRAAAIASEGYGLTTRLLQAQGNTAELRRRELEALDPANRAILESIFALEDQKAATDAAAQAAAQAARDQEQAAETAARAAERLRDAWQSVSDSLFDEASRIRGITSGADAPTSLAAAQAKFAITNAQAQANDQEAAKLLPALARSLVELAESQATSLAELQRIRAQTAASLETTGGTIAGRYGLSIPKLATGTNYVPRDMLAMLHEGEQVVPKAYNPAASGVDQQAMLQELRALRAEVAALKSETGRGADASEKSRDVLVNVTRNGDVLQVEIAP